MIMQSWLNTLVSGIRSTGRRRHRRSYQQQIMKRYENSATSEVLEDRALLTATVTPGELVVSQYIHATEPGHPDEHDAHIITDSAHHTFAWLDRDASTPGVIDIWYDYRDITIDSTVYSNDILTTQRQEDRIDDVLQMWETGTNGYINFVQNTTADSEDIINIGTGNFAVFEDPLLVSGPGGVLGATSRVFGHAEATSHSISEGLVWMDSAETWDLTKGNGNPAGTFDFFTVAAHEVGHALGLGHIPIDFPTQTSNENIMDAGYIDEQTALSVHDIEHIQHIYHAPPTPVFDATVTGSALTIVATVGGGAEATFVVENLNGIDTIVFDVSGGERHEITLGNIDDVFIILGSGGDTLTVGSRPTQITSFRILAGAGSDLIDVRFAPAGAGGIGFNISGNSGNDTLIGGDGADTIDGNHQSDLIFGEGGNDSIFGGAGHDTIDAGAGDDTIRGEAGTDLIFGVSGANIVLGGGGADTLVGGIGNDNLNGQSGYDLIFGFDGNDTLVGGSGNDSLYGENGDDLLKGQGGSGDYGDGGLGEDLTDGNVETKVNTEDPN